MDDEELTTAQVADLLGVARSTISRTPREKLPFRKSPNGHRYYRRQDVEAMARDMARPLASTGIEERVAALEEWRRRHEGEHQA